jgi:hypothetical protein
VGAAITAAFPRGALALRYFFGWDATARFLTHPRPWLYFSAASLNIAIAAAVYVLEGRRAIDLQGLLTDLPKLLVIVIGPFVLRCSAELAPLAPVARSYECLSEGAARAPLAEDNRAVDSALALALGVALYFFAVDMAKLDYFAGGAFGARSALAQANILVSIATAVATVFLLLVGYALLVLTLRLHTQWARVLCAVYARRDASLASAGVAAAAPAAALSAAAGEGGVEATKAAEGAHAHAHAPATPAALRAAAAAWWARVLAGARDGERPRDAALARRSDVVEVDHVADAYDALREAVASAAFWWQFPIVLIVALFAFVTLIAALTLTSNGAASASASYFAPFLFIAPASILITLAPIVTFNAQWLALVRDAKVRAWEPAERMLLHAHFERAPLAFTIFGVVLSWEGLAKLVGSALAPLLVSGALSIKSGLAAALDGVGGNGTAAGNATVVTRLFA